MKVVAFIVDLVVLGGLVVLMMVVMGDTYTHGNILFRSILMGAVGALYGIFRSVYRKWLLPKEDN